MMTQMMMQSSMENQMMPQMMRGATITDSKEPVETLGATITYPKEQVAQNVWEPDDDERWEVMVFGYFWENGRPKFKYIIIEKEVACKQDADSRQPYQSCDVRSVRWCYGGAISTMAKK